MTRVGADVKFLEGASLLGDDPWTTLVAVHELGFEGILVRTVDEAFPTLDSGAIDEFAQEAARRGMFVQLGLGKVNPYMTAELPRIRDLGGGSYLDGMVRLIELCAAHGWNEAWTATGGFKHDLPAPFCFDRFRTDADWSDQLAAIARLLRMLAPALRANGVRLNLETHEEITTFEILRLIDEVGADVVGVCLDPGNLMVRGEVPDEAIARVAPYTHMTHLRDAVLAPTDDGLARFLMPVGEGVVDWGALLDAVLAADPGIDLAIEGIGGSRAEMVLQPQDARWRNAHPDLTDRDIRALASLADGYAADAAAGRSPSLADLRLERPEGPDYRDFLTRSLATLQEAVAHRAARRAVPTRSAR